MSTGWQEEIDPAIAPLRRYRWGGAQIQNQAAEIRTSAHAPESRQGLPNNRDASALTNGEQHE